MVIFYSYVTNYQRVMFKTLLKSLEILDLASGYD